MRVLSIAYDTPKQACFINDTFKNFFLFKIEHQRTVLNRMEQSKTSIVVALVCHTSIFLFALFNFFLFPRYKNCIVSYRIWWCVCYWGNNVKYKELSQSAIHDAWWGNFHIDKGNRSIYKISCKISLLNYLVKSLEKYPWGKSFRQNCRSRTDCCRLDPFSDIF